MPGIVGIISQRPAELCEPVVRSMVASMEHERFYTSGLYVAPEMGIYGGWIALEDSFAAGGVFFNEQRDVALILSGECFVDPETRTDLRQKGHRIGKNKGDWLVHLYEEDGNQFFERLNGFFAGILIDRRIGRAFLFNDRYGLDRLYVHETAEAVYFASEAKALLRVLPYLREFDEHGVAQFLTFGCTLEGRTLFRGIHLLPGGSLWSFEKRNCHKTKYFSAKSWESQQAFSDESFVSEFEQTFKRILPRYFDSESKIGISLTAGLDTRMIMACLPETRENTVCYTYSGQTVDTLDARLAAQIAAACGLQHTILRIRPAFFSNFQALADRTVYLTDGCFGISGAHEIYMSEQARSLSSVRLTGVFGGEVLRGVSTFKPLGLCQRLFGPEMQSLMKPLTRGSHTPNEHSVTFAAFKEIPWNLFGTVMACRSQLAFRTPYLDNDLMALAYRAPLSMRHSPVPAMRVVKNNSQTLSEIPTDMGYLGKVSRLPTWWGRVYSRLTFKLDYLNNEGWPHWLSAVEPLLGRFAARAKIVGLHKHLHYRSWFRHELAQYVNNILTDASIRNISFFDRKFIEQISVDHIGGRKNYLGEINAVLTLEAVDRLIIHGLSYGQKSSNSKNGSDDDCRGMTRIASA